MAKFSEWRLVVVEVPITVSLAAYTAGDTVGGLLTSAAIKQVYGGGYIAWARLIDDHAQSEAFKLWGFYEAPTSIVDADLFTMTEDDWAKWFTTIDIPTTAYDTTGSERCAMVDGKDVTTGEYQMFPALGSGTLSLYLVAEDTPDYADADDLTLHLGLMVL